MAWGYMFSLDLAKCCKYSIGSDIHVKNFMRRLVKDIDMVPYGPCHVHKFGSGNKAGLSAFQLIETSNISAHFCDESGDAYIDIFSCKPYDKTIVKNLAKYYFGPESIKEHYIERDASKNVELQ